MCIQISFDQLVASFYFVLLPSSTSKFGVTIQSTPGTSKVPPMYEIGDTEGYT